MTSGVIFKFETFKDLEAIEHKYLSVCSKIDPKSFKCSDLLLAKEDDLAIYYCPFKANLDLKRLAKTKVVLVGITPGETQAIKAMEAHQSAEHIYNRAAFSGSMRPRLLKSLELIGLHTKLNINAPGDLFEEKHSSLLYSTSLIKYPAFYKEKPYSGQQPRILKSNLLRRTFELFTLPVLEEVRSDQIIIPMGDRVSEVLKSHYPNRKNTLFGFPHPSGANPKCSKFLRESQGEMEKILFRI